MKSKTETDIELSIVMPCLDEAETLGICIQKCQNFIKAHNLSAEIIIADNGSTDGSQKIATDVGARVVPVTIRGYGAALIGGIEAAKGRYVAMGDADDSYDFATLMPFIEKLRAGYDLCMGNRFQGGIAKGAMPPLHRYLGNPVLSFVGRLFYNIPIGDFHCGLRAFNKQSIMALNLNTTGMEFASEMVVKAALNRLKIAEAPTTLSPDGRTRPPHLRSWRDGWRHLKFLLTFAPKWLYLFPGLVLLGFGLIGLVWLLPGDGTIGNIKLGVHTLLFCSSFVLMSSQVLSFAFLARLFGVREGFWREGELLKRVREWFSVETGCIIGGIMIAAGAALSVRAVAYWAEQHYGPIAQSNLMRLTIPAVLLLCLGLQSVFTAFFAGLLTQPKPIKVLH
ncbi:MAG: glycosyl transferase family 2 [Hyphomonadaceae bacterium]|nr:MAG: glycosyl transferase family 2 [Hyphomonadaceae bacterium]KAF0187091.1 MAG: glycosyl transferase family 2 [Hyphomonadaceae bacterium]